MVYPGRKINGKQEGIIHFTRDHSILRRDEVVEDRKVSTSGNSGKGKRDQDFYATIRVYK